MLVEIMTMAGFSKEAMCRELVYRQQPCADVETLDRAFAEELANGRQRRLTGYIVKLHTIAMGNGNSSLSALKFVLSKIGGAVWAGGSDTGDMEDAALVAAAAIAGNGTETRRIYIPARLPEPPDDAGPVIEGETEEAA